MIMITSVAEWIANFLVFSISCAIIVGCLFGLLMIVTIGMDFYNRLIDK